MTSSFLVWLQQDNGTWVTQHPVETLPLFLPDVAAEKEYKPFFLERKKIKKKNCTAANRAKPCSFQFLHHSYSIEPMVFLGRDWSQGGLLGGKVLQALWFPCHSHEKTNSSRARLCSCWIQPNTTHIKGVALHSYWKAGACQPYVPSTPCFKLLSTGLGKGLCWGICSYSAWHWGVLAHDWGL